jgi:hypothetical protein
VGLYLKGDKDITTRRAQTRHEIELQTTVFNWKKLAQTLSYQFDPLEVCLFKPGSLFK